MKNDEKKELRQIAQFSKKNVKTPDLLPFAQYKDDCFHLRNGTYLDYVKVICKDVLSLSQENRDAINYTFEKFYKTYAPDIKLIGSNMPVDTTANQNYLNLKIDKCNNPIQKQFLEEELSYEKVAQEIITERQFYIAFFFKSLQERQDGITDCLQTLGEHFLVELLNQAEKETIVFQLCNKNVPVDIEQLHSLHLPRQEVIDEYVNKFGYDPYLISRIQPNGGISFKDDKFISTGTGYEACIHIYDYKRQIDEFWLNPILNIENVISITDISTENIEEVNKNIAKSMDEQDSRIESTDKRGEVIDACNRIEELRALYQEINSFEEIIKLLHIRLFVTGLTKEDVEKNVANIISKLKGKGFKGAVYLGEAKNEWISMFQSYEEQKKSDYARYGQVVPSHHLAFGNPCIFSSLNDPYGNYMGTTINTGGIFNFDLWTSTKYRTQYNLLCAGAPGAGKSTFLKLLSLIQFSHNNMIRGFDVKDEYPEIINIFGGKMVYLDGSKGRINHFDILETDNNDISSYTKHISKLRVIYKFFKRSATDDELSTFTDMVNLLYKKFNLRGDDGRKITGLPAECYPTYSDLLDVINEEISHTNTDGSNIVQQQLEIEKKKLMLSVQNTIKEIVTSFGNVFDGHTTIDDIFNEQVVFFNISKLKNFSDSVFAAQVYNALMLCWDNCIKKQTPIKNDFIDGKIKWEDITKFIICMDESHRLINTRNDFVIDPIATFMREGRHLFCSFLFASQNASDFIPRGSSNESIDKLQALFELCQYKFIMKQDSNTLPLLERIFNGQMTESEINTIPRFERGQGIMSIAGDKNILVNIDVSDERLAFFKGGA